MFSVVFRLGLILAVCHFSSRIGTAGEISFLGQIAPILTQRCLGCHGPLKADGDLRLHTIDAILTPGASGVPTIRPGQPEQSELWVRLIAEDESVRMPQWDDPVSATEIELVKQWIAEGADFATVDHTASIKSQMPPRIHPISPSRYHVPVPVNAVAFSPDGTVLAVGGHHEILIWDVATTTLLRRLQRLPERIQALDWTMDGKRLFLAGGTPGDYGELSFVNIEGEAPPVVCDTFDDIVLDVGVSRSGQQLVAASADRSVRCYGASDGRKMWRSQLHSDFVTAVDFSHDDRFIATGSTDFTIKVLHAENGQLFTTYNGHQRQFGDYKGRFAIFAVAFSNTQPLAFSAGQGNAIRIWEPEKAQAENGSAADMEERFSNAGHTKHLPHGSQRSVFQLRVYGNRLFAATGDGVIKEYDTLTLSHIRDYVGHRDWIFALDYHPLSGHLATGSYDGEVRLWDVTTGETIAAFAARPQ